MNGKYFGFGSRTRMNFGFDCFLFFILKFSFLFFYLSTETTWTCLLLFKGHNLVFVEFLVGR